MSEIYTMKQVCRITGLTYDTLKYYCIEGLVPNHKRNQSNHRVFDDKDVNWIKGLICLRNCGMSIKSMKDYMNLCMGGIETIDNRKKMLEETEAQLNKELQRIIEAKKYIENKFSYYQSIVDGEIEYSSNLD